VADVGNGLTTWQDESQPIDDGTLARAHSPTPGPVGIEAKAASSPASIPDRVVSFARRRLGTRYLDGECFTLADRALRAAGARSAADYGTVTPDADYVWGTQVSLSEFRPGDVIQFRDYACTLQVVTQDEGGTTTEEVVQERPHHTAIVEGTGDDGAVTVLEQNSPEGSPVTRNELFFENGESTDGRRKTRVRVQGTFWFYRPGAR
jgi:hypothetical protein